MVSRSHRKTPCSHVSPIHGKYKKLYNRRLRRLGFDEVPDGNAYRRMNQSWNIDEARCIGTSYQAYRDSCLRWGDFLDEETCRNEYEKYHLRK